MRIVNHPIIEFEEGKKVTFTYNNQTLFGKTTDTIASALHANGITTLSRSIKHDNPRGFFCGIGKCSSCLMRVNEVPNVRTCIAPLKEGITVTQQDHFGELPNTPFSAQPKQTITTETLIVGAGPAGLCAANKATEQGAHVLIVDENIKAGGQLIKQTHKFFGSKQERAGTRGITIAEQLTSELLKNPTANLMLDTTVIGYYGIKDKHHTFALLKRNPDYTTQLIEVQTTTAIIATGATENLLLFPGNDLPGVYGAGGVQTLMNVYGVKPGNRVVMVGAGNVGLIVSYQLLQAGIDVACVVEAAPQIGGYHVHAAKLRRCGVPIHTKHTIQTVHGDERVTGCTIVTLDDQWKPIPQTEQNIPCDTICLAVGLTPSTRLIGQTGSTLTNIQEAGGYIALHDETMQSTIPGIYIAGDASGIEEASTAMIEGEIAGLAAAHHLGYNKNYEQQLQASQQALKRLRAGPFGEKPRIAKERIKTMEAQTHA